jgi:NAD(P)-dependent dehydrogenase (short-subunit alcohol dehydrogenase family)
MSQQVDATNEKKLFSDRVAIVTGAGRGLGRDYALELAKRGAKIVVNDFGGSVDGSDAGSSLPADEVVNEIKKTGGQAIASYDTVATLEGGQAIVNKAIEAFGRVDILINNAGILRDKTLAKMDWENWNAVLSVHLHGAYNVTRPAVIKMQEGGYGRIVMTTSAAGLYGNYGQTNYSAAKLGVVGMMNTLKLECKKFNIKVNSIAPMGTTRLTESAPAPDELREKLKVGFVTPLVLYLCSESCAETGMIFTAGMGYFSRVAVMTSPGIVIGDGKQIPTLEDIIRFKEKILNMDGCMEFYNTMDMTVFAQKQCC